MSEGDEGEWDVEHHGNHGLKKQLPASKSAKKSVPEDSRNTTNRSYLTQTVRRG